MAKTKKKVLVEKKPRKDSRIEEVYEEEVTFNCPVRGKVTQKVKIKRFKPLAEQATKHLIATIDELTSKLDEHDDGLAIYSDGEELGIVGPAEEN